MPVGRVALEIDAGARAIILAHAVHAGSSDSTRRYSAKTSALMCPESTTRPASWCSMASKRKTEFERPQGAVLAERLVEPRRFLQIVAGPRQAGKSTLVQQVRSSKAVTACRQLGFGSNLLVQA